jgi:tryptophanyl-tRNA synthetase
VRLLKTLGLNPREATMESDMTKKRMLSGVQATGSLHLGNYLGAIRNWALMQDEFECFFFLADLHAITVERSAKELRNSILNTTAGYLACGLDPAKSTLFAQSHIHEHSELAWIFNCSTPLGWLKRMTQFKDKAGKDQEKASCGLFTYPVLMAADILLYQPDFVPVGEDQKQHIELARDIAGTMNRKFGQDIFKMPEPLIKKEAARIMSLRDGTKKMSKSDPSDASRINLSDDADSISQKFKKSKTDSFAHISYDKTTRPDVSNLIEIYGALSGESHEKIVANYEGEGFAKFKGDLADLAVAKLAPINERYNQYLGDEAYLRHVLNDGASRARVFAVKTLREVKEGLGYI